MQNVFTVLILLAVAAVTVTLGFGIYSLFRGGDYARSHSNKLMRLRIVLQAVPGRSANGRSEQDLHSHR